MTVKNMQLNYVILAAGQGRRMKANIPKILHKLAGKTLIEHCLNAAQSLKPDTINLVLAEKEKNNSEIDVIIHDFQKRRSLRSLTLSYQKAPAGTADAVHTALPYINKLKKESDIIILYGDTPLLTKKTLKKIYHALQKGNDMVIAGFYTDKPVGYGRIIMQDSKPAAIREEINLSVKEKNIKLCNSGVFGFKKETLIALLQTITKDKKSGEYYLTDMLEKGTENNKAISLILCDEEEIIGVNTPYQLSLCEKILQKKLRNNALEKGVIMTDPDSVFLSADTEIGAQTHIEPYVVIGEKCQIGKHVTIKSFSYMEGTRIRDHAIVGPYARLRSGTDIGAHARIGNFVEIKKSTIKQQSKINHLSYIGDSEIGKNTNIGAGVITCNYDGVRKYQTKIGHYSFIGSNVALVAPIHIGDNAYVGAGSTIRKNVDKNKLVVTKQNILTKIKK